ncbi:MAG: hypothetical protein ACFCUM_11810 [Bacteroidales bacterium]
MITQRFILLLGISFLLSIFSCTKEENHAPSKPTSTIGTDNTCEVLRPTLSWACTDEDGDKLYFTLMFGTSEGSLSELTTDQSSFTYTFTEELLPSTKYYWQIIASDGQDKTSGDVWKFSTVSNPIDVRVPSVPVLISPLTEQVRGSILFKWQGSEDDATVNYTLTINDVNVIENTVDTTFNFEVIENFKWFVTAYDDHGNSSESEHVSVKVK